MENILQGEIGYDINLDSFQNGKSFLINSFGGSLFEGLAIYDYIKGNNIEVGVIGVCASAATLPVIASANSWATPNSRFLIHNPSSGIEGTASDMGEAADQLKLEQQRAVQLYSEHLNISAEEIQALMNEEKFITAQEALAIGLIKEIKEFSKTETVKPDADLKLLYNQFKMKIDMSENATKEDVGRIEGLINDVKTLFSAKQKEAPKMIVLTAADGTSLDFGEVLTEEEIAVGVMATVEGSNAEGTYVMPDGRSFVFVGGELMEIIDPIDAEAVEAENTELKAANTELQESNETMKAELEEKTQMLADAEAKMKIIDADMVKIKTKFSSNKPPVNTPPTERNEKKKFNFKSKK